ncbi:MAG: transporter substrate-binding domain-containing protein [Prevotella sp.]|nr:transporter substrate-binding domain-containing protein [Prevotella sp.]
MTKAYRTIIILLLLAAILPSFALAQDKPQASAARVYDEEHPLVYEDAWDLWPYVFLDDDGTPTGYNVDMLKLIFQELNIPYIIHLKPNRQALEDLRAGKSDLMLGMVANFHDEYTQLYGKNSIHLFTHSVAHPKTDLQEVHELNDLSNQKVIVHEGSFSHHLMQDRGWGDNAIPYGDMDKAIQMVSAEERGQVLWNTMSLKWLIHKYHADNLELSPVAMPSGDYRFMTNDSVLLKQLDDTYMKLKASERLQPLEAKWFHPEDNTTDNSPDWLWYVALAIGLVILILIIASIIYHIQERIVTREWRKRNDRLALILKTCNMEVWTYDLHSDTFKSYGENAMPEATLKPAQFAKHYTKTDYDKVMEAIRRLANLEAEEVTLEIAAKSETDGKPRTGEMNLSVLRSHKGKPAIIIGTMVDMTEAREKLRQSEELKHRYASVFNTAMIDMIYYNAQGQVANMNDRAQRTFGITLDEAKETFPSLWETIGVDDFDYYYATQFVDLDNNLKHTTPRHDDGIICYEQQLIPVHDENQQLLGIYGTGRDVTEAAINFRTAHDGVNQLRIAMQELATQVNNINYAMQVGGVRMVSYSPQTHLLTINHRMHEAQYILTQQRCIQFTAPDSLAQVMQMMRSMDRKDNKVWDCGVKTRLRVPGGNQLCLQVHFFPTLSPNGIVEEYKGICRDTTEIKHTEHMLQLETEKAQEVELLKNKFLHNMCFEIRTPVDIVVKYAEMLEQQHDAEHEDAYIAEIKKNSAYLLELINDILFLSRLDAKMVEINVQPCDFASTFEGHCQMVWQGMKKKEVRYVVENHYDQLVVDIDDTNLGRIIEQVVKNATEHTEEGYVRTQYEYIGGKLIISVSDTGSGIEKEKLQHIFERFNISPAKEHSTGLGLPICQELATQLGGNIEISSQLGKGTTVWITIPCQATTIVRKKEI